MGIRSEQGAAGSNSMCAQPNTRSRKESTEPPRQRSPSTLTPLPLILSTYKRLPGHMKRPVVCRLCFTTSNPGSCRVLETIKEWEVAMGRKNLNRYSNMFLGPRMHYLLAMSVLGLPNDRTRILFFSSDWHYVAAG